MALAIPASLSAQPARLGPELQVNSYTFDQQTAPAVAIEADGDFVVAWSSSPQDGNNLGVFAKRFSSAGVPATPELQINDFTLSTQSMPAVATDGAGELVIVWRTANQDDGFAGAVFAKVFDGDVSGEFQVNSYTLNSQTTPSVAMDADGDFVVAWGSKLQDGSGYGIFARRFAAGGAPLASEFRVNSYTPGYQSYPAVATSASGDFVIVWLSYGQDGFYGGAFGRRFSSAGTPLASEFQINSYTLSRQYQPVAVAASSSGDFVVAWSSRDQDGQQDGVFARRFSSAGAALATEFQVNTYTTSGQNSPSVAAEPDGDFVIVWDSYTQDGNVRGVFGRRFSSAGSALAVEFQVNAYTPGGQADASVAVGPADGQFVVAWRSDFQDGAFSGVFAQRFGPAVLAPFDIDGDGGADPLTDGLLVLRFLFGFTGSALTSGAVDAQSCTRCDATTIEGDLASIQSQLDVDGNGSALALTDGLLILRYLFDFTGATLIAGAVDLAHCTRCDATAIESYLAGLV